VRPNSKVILPYEPGYTGHWEMEKRRKETRDWLREREQQLKDRINGPSIVRPRPEAVVVTDPKKKHIR
jgi:ribosomal protein S2